MSQLEQSSIATLTTKPRLWLRFVDDILSIVRKDWVDKTLRHLNSQHEDIVFTSEIEADGKLPYLDAKIERNGSAFRQQCTENRLIRAVTFPLRRTTR